MYSPMAFQPRHLDAEEEAVQRGGSLPTKLHRADRHRPTEQSGGTLRFMRRRHTHGDGSGLDEKLRSLGASFRRELSEYKSPSLGRLASEWDAPFEFNDAGVLDGLEIPKLDVETTEAQELCVPGTKWHKALIILASSVSFGGSFARTILSAVSGDVRMSMIFFPLSASFPYHVFKNYCRQIMTDFQMTRETYGALSGLPAIPNIFASPIGGAIVDRLGAGEYS